MRQVIEQRWSNARAGWFREQVARCDEYIDGQLVGTLTRWVDRGQNVWRWTPAGEPIPDVVAEGVVEDHPLRWRRRTSSSRRASAAR